MFEAAKGAVVLLAGFGVLLALDHGVAPFADALVRHMHLNPAKEAPRIFLALLNEHRDELAAIVQRAEADADGIAFATEREQALQARLAEVEAALKAAGDQPEFEFDPEAEAEDEDEGEGEAGIEESDETDEPD